MQYLSKAIDAIILILGLESKISIGKIIASKQPREHLITQGVSSPILPRMVKNMKVPNIVVTMKAVVLNSMLWSFLNPKALCVTSWTFLSFHNASLIDTLVTMAIARRPNTM